MSDGTEEILSMFRGGNSRHYKRMSTILYQGEVPRYVYIIKSGVVRSYNISESGEQRIVELYSAGHIVPVSWVFDISNAALYYYDAFSDAEVYRITKDQFTSVIAQNNASATILKSIARRYSASTVHLNALLQSNAQNKITQGLQYLVLCHGRKLQNGRHRVTIRLTQQDLANLVGVTRETATVELNKLRQKGIIEYSRFTYTVDYDSLVRIGGGDEFNGLVL